MHKEEAVALHWHLHYFKHLYRCTYTTLLEGIQWDLRIKKTFAQLYYNFVLLKEVALFERSKMYKSYRWRKHFGTSSYVLCKEVHSTVSIFGRIYCWMFRHSILRRIIIFNQSGACRSIRNLLYYGLFSTYSSWHVVWIDSGALASIHCTYSIPISSTKFS